MFVSCRLSIGPRRHRIQVQIPGEHGVQPTMIAYSSTGTSVNAREPSCSTHQMSQHSIPRHPTTSIWRSVPKWEIKMTNSQLLIQHKYNRRRQIPQANYRKRFTVWEGEIGGIKTFTKILSAPTSIFKVRHLKTMNMLLKFKRRRSSQTQLWLSFFGSIINSDTSRLIR